jgi:hypothetical protein
MPSLILSRRHFDMPKQCCVCGAETELIVKDRQESLPSVMPVVPPVYLIRVDGIDVSAPYCETHAKTYISRQRTYYVLQSIAFLTGCTLCFVGSQNKGVPEIVSIVGFAFICLAILLFLFKAQILYDMKLRKTPKGLVLIAPSNEFLKSVELALQKPIEHKPIENVGDRLKNRVRVDKARKRIYGNKPE